MNIEKLIKFKNKQIEKRNKKGVIYSELFNSCKYKKEFA